MSVSQNRPAGDATCGTRDMAGACETIANAWPRRPGIGIILGTGSSQVAAEINVEQSWPYEKLPGFARATATGHRGQLLCGQLGGAAVVAMNGRFHLYEGYSVRQIALPIQVMRQLGVHVLLISNAAGGLNPSYRSGELMLIESHLDLMFRRWPQVIPHSSDHSTDSPPRNGSAELYDSGLRQLARRAAADRQLILHRGVYAALLGPCYETRAEYRMLRRIGADVVGMSTVPEVVVAAQIGMRVLACSIVANVANPDQLAPTSGQQVVEAAGRAADDLAAIVQAVIKDVQQTM